MIPRELGFIALDSFVPFFRICAGSNVCTHGKLTICQKSEQALFLLRERVSREYIVLTLRFK